MITLSSCDPPHQQKSTPSFESSCIKIDETIVDTQGTTNMDDFYSKIVFVQERISETIDDERFQNGSLNDKLQLIELVLSELIEQGYITNYKTNLEQRIPCITLFYNGGGTSTVLLEDFPADEN